MSECQSSMPITMSFINTKSVTFFFFFFFFFYSFSLAYNSNKYKSIVEDRLCKQTDSQTVDVRNVTKKGRMSRVILICLTMGVHD